MADFDFQEYKKYYIKFDEIPAEYKDLAEFACDVCMTKKKMCSLKYSGCACRNIGKEYCSEIGRVIEKRQRERENGR